MKFLTIVGLVLSTIWLLVMFVLINWKFESVGAMDLNEIGDFLAGVTAPLALLWLVIGYFQQGKEISQNTKALKLQVEETAQLARNAERQAAATEQMAILNKTQYETEEAREHALSQPLLISSGGTTSQGSASKTHLQNKGGPVTNIEIKSDAPYSINFSPVQALDEDQKATLTIAPELGNSLQYPINFELHYTDAVGKKQMKLYSMIGNHDLRDTKSDA